MEIIYSYLVAKREEKNPQDLSSITPFQLVMYNGHKENALFLMHMGTDIRLRDKSNHISLHMAAGMARRISKSC